jgi:DNA-binding transcriptional LysR family regulator
VSLSSLDLNLLLVLHTVLSERSVARAAERLHVTPSAISNSLARLRVELGDPLVARKGRGIVPTPRAVELGPALARALQELERALRGAPFDAASTTRTFTLAMADAGQMAWLPDIAQLLEIEMPNARLRVVGIDSLVSLGDLSSTEIDVHVGVSGRSPGLHAEPLVDERTTLVARSGNPAAAGRLSPRALGELRHVAVQMVPSKAFLDPVSSAYAREGARREVVLSVPTFTAAAAVAAGTDLVATLPASLFARQGAALRLRAVEGQVPVHAVTLSLCWHERTHADPAAAAFRAIVRRAVTRQNESLPRLRGRANRAR